ncbi:hypothetical protein [Gordonia jinhuaensis]|nr:hypothetical protein [Gordonia jinhuaensis]
MAARIATRWTAGVMKAGGRKPGSVSVDLCKVRDEGAEFIGGYLAKSTLDHAAKIGAEVAAGTETKVAARQNLSPFEVLRAVTEGVDARSFGIRTPRRWQIVELEDQTICMVDLDTNEVTRISPPGLWALWTEWELASLGRRQIVWGRVRPGPLGDLWAQIVAARGQTATSDDEAIAATDLNGETLGEISRAGWYRMMVWRPSWLVEALEAAEGDDGASATARWMSDRGVEYRSN